MQRFVFILVIAALASCKEETVTPPQPQPRADTLAVVQDTNTFIPPDFNLTGYDSVRCFIDIENSGPPHLIFSIGLSSMDSTNTDLRWLVYGDSIGIERKEYNVLVRSSQILYPQSVSVFPFVITTSGAQYFFHSYILVAWKNV